MEVFGPELNALFLRPFLDDAEATVGKDRVETLLAEYDVKRTELEAPGVWIRLAFGEILVDRLAALERDPTMVERCGRLAFRPKYVGMLGPILKVLGTPRMGYMQLRAGLPRFNKVGRMATEPKGFGHVVVHYGCQENAPREQLPTTCLTRAANLAGMTTMFDLPPATVTHVKCMNRGDDECVYDVRYTEPIRRIRSTAGLLLGVALGASSVLLGWPGWAAALAAVGAGIAGFALGRWRELGEQLRTTLHEVNELRDALTRSAHANEQRFEELLEAKAGVERKVEDRTRELRDTTAQLERTLLEVRALDSAKTDFFANVSHDLRTPLTLLVGPLEDLLHGREPPGGTKAALEAMHRNGQRLLRLINQLLDLAKVDAGGARLARAFADPTALLRAAAAPFEEAAKARGITLVVEAEERLAPIWVDANWVESALSNLLGNALRFTRPDGHVTASARELGHEVVFAVEDDGIGIAPADVPHVFDRFAQGAGDVVRGGGTGLGLAIVRETARLHDGDVRVESEPGRGARFTLRIPRRASADARDGVQVPAASPAATPPAVVELGPTAPARTRRDGPGPAAPLALVAEDHDDIRAFVADVLAARYRVVAVPDGRAALAAALAEPPAVIVSDVAMPGMDGLALCRALREDPRTRHVPFVLLTAHGDVAHVLAGFDAGADDYVGKPFHARELLARVDARVQLHQLAAELAHRERLALLGVAAASIAHQVRNPLTSIRTGLPVVRARLSDHLDARGRELIDAMIAGAATIEDLTTDLLDVSRVDRAAVSFCHPADGLLSALRLVRARLPESVAVHVDLDESLETMASAGDLNHLFLNLVDNAARAVGDTGKIDVSLRRDEGACVVEIGDSGAGVSPSVAARLFEPFVTTRAAGEGTGLGLVIAKQIVDRHGGSISVGTSALGGALFTVRIPIRSAAPEPRAAAAP